MEDYRLTRTEDKLDKIVERIGSIDSTLAAQHVSLAEHMKRSEANEKALETLKEEIKPVFTHIYIINLIGKLSLLALTSGGAVKFIQWLNAH